MKKQHIQQEKGSVLIEVIAVVALLGVMGPMLFKQVAERNEEVENINIASEMRIMKEAFSSYIMNYHSEILSGCTKNICPPSQATIMSYLPAGFEGTMDGYSFTIVKDESKLGSSTLQGFIIPNLSTLGLNGLSLKRVARIATLIGADGGIKRKNNSNIHGTGGAWQYSTDKFGEEFTIPDTDNLFIATTGIDTYVPTVRYEDFDQANILMPDQGYAIKKLHAWNAFSVGTVDSAADTRCFEMRHNSTSVSGTKTTAQNDIIYNPYETSNNCDPLFWVTADGGNGIAGNVFVKNQLHLRDTPSGKTSVLIASGPTSASATIDRNKDRKIVVYTSNGKEAVTINGQGEIILRGGYVEASQTISGETEPELLTLKNGRLETNVKAEKASEDADSVQAYRVDPRFTSVMGDIRLESRGGARLSELLPVYTLQNITTITTTFNETTLLHNDETIAVPSCPTDHVPAIVVTPVKWHQTSEQDVITSAINNLKADSDGTLRQKETIVPSEKAILPSVTISYGEKNANYVLQNTTAAATAAWTVSLQYKLNGAPVTNIKEPIIASVHTYCVYSPSSSNQVHDRPNDDTVIIGN